MGPGFCPEIVRKSDSGVAADQTNAMLATSKEVIFSLCRNPPQKRATNELSYCCGRLLHLAGKAPQIASCGLSRVASAAFSGTGNIDTIGTVQLDEPLSVAAAHHTGNADFS